MMEEIFFEIAIILVIAASMSMIIYRLRQPLIIAYIITGVIAGPSVFRLAQSPEVLDVMSEIGIAFLLFTVGLGLNWRSVKEVGGISLATGVGQVIVTTILGFLIGQALGFDVVTSFFLALAFTFSSTIIVVKFLMDKEDLETLYGRISVGFLLVQDFIAMIILLGLGAFSSGASLQDVFVGSIIKALIVIPVLWFLSAKVVPRLVAYAARSQELLFIYAIGWCFFIAMILAYAGFGVEVGALIAGVTLSGTVFQREINSRIRPLRDFFLIMFFILLGTHLSLSAFVASIVPIVIFSIFILIGNPLVVMIIMKLLGYHPRTGFFFGTSIAQISEFSFIVIAAGVAAGFLDDSAIALATSIGLITIAGSAYLIEHNNTLYEKLSPFFTWLEPTHILDEERLKEHKPSHIVLFGFHRMGHVLLETIRKMKKSYTVVDFDPLVIKELAESGEPAVYGDAGDSSFLKDIKIDKAKIIISTIPDFLISINILHYLKIKKYNGVVVVSARTHEDAEHAYKLGATYVIIPSVLSGKKFSEILHRKKIDKKIWHSFRDKHYCSSKKKR